MEEATIPGAPPSSLISNLRTSPGNIRSLILEKEKELHDINEYRIHTLESLLKEKVCLHAFDKSFLMIFVLFCFLFPQGNCSQYF
jgi:hypothetical protein